MSNAKKIRTTIGSVDNTRKITKAMQLVATSKLGKSQSAMAATRPYADKIRDVIGHLAASHSEYHHPYMQHREVTSKVGYIIVSSDRGLCGGLNTNLFRETLKHLREWDKKGIKAEACLFGSKAIASFGSVFEVIAHANQLGDKPSVMDIVGIVKVMLAAYKEGRIDAVYIASNRFVSTMTQKPQILQLLPLVVDKKSDGGRYWDYIYEPEAKALLDVLLNRYIESQVYQAVIENVACEQAARMMAMQSATDNAKQVIDELTLAYNKARQASITQELSEIVAGAEAVN